MSRYFAFISYSHADAATARWLHKSLETYRLPRAVRGAHAAGALPERLAPVFLDRAELATSAELGAEIEKALGESENLIVLCSPQAARSRWVNEEIRRFAALGREERVFCLIVPSDEHAGDGVFFPPALLERRGSEPLAADVRPSRDGRQDGFLKLVAGMLGLRFDELRRREQARRQRRMAVITAGSVAASIVLAALAGFALLARQEAERQRAIAEQRSLTAERTTAFLQSLFAVSDPSEARGNTITAREVLDRGAREIDTGLRDEPGVRATLIATLGSVYASLGLYRQADDLLGKADVATPLDPEADALVAIARGELRTAQGEYPAANQDFERALDALRDAGPERDAERARALIAWGESLASTDDYAAAREKIAEGIDAARRAQPEAKALIVRGLEARGLTALLAGELDEAEPVYRQALAMRIAESGEIHPKVSEDLNSLGSIEYLRGNRAQAAEYFTRVLEIERKVFSPTHRALAATLNNLARVQLEQRKYREAREQLLVARDLDLAESSATRDDMAFVFSNLALAEVGLGNDVAAKELFVSAWAAADKHRHRLRGPILTDLADLECRAKRHAEAAARMERARALLAEDYPDDPWRMAWLELVRASCLLSAGEASAADALLSTHLEPVLERWPDDTMLGLSALERAAAIRRGAGNPKNAEAFSRRVARVRGTAHF